MSMRSDSIPRSHMFVKRTALPNSSLLASYPVVSKQTAIPERRQNIVRSSTCVAPVQKKTAAQTIIEGDTSLASSVLRGKAVHEEGIILQAGHSALGATRSLPVDHLGHIATAQKSSAQTLQRKEGVSAPVKHTTAKAHSPKTKSIGLSNGNPISVPNDTHLSTSKSSSKSYTAASAPHPDPHQDLAHLFTQMINPIIDDPGQLAHAAVNTLARHYQAPSTTNFASSSATLQDIILKASQTLIDDPAQFAHSAITTLTKKIRGVEPQAASRLITQDLALTVQLDQVRQERDISEYQCQELQGRFRGERKLRLRLERQLRESQVQVGCLTEELSAHGEPSVMLEQGHTGQYEFIHDYEARYNGTAQIPRKRQRIESDDEPRNNECLVEASDDGDEGSMSLD